MDKKLFSEEELSTLEKIEIVGGIGGNFEEITPIDPNSQWTGWGCKIGNGCGNGCL